MGGDLGGTNIASQNRSDHGGRKRARNHSAAETAGFFASPAAKKSLAASDFWDQPQIAVKSQRPRPQVAAAARFRGRSDHGTLRGRHSIFGHDRAHMCETGTIPSQCMPGMRQRVQEEVGALRGTPRFKSGRVLAQSPQRWCLLKCLRRCHGTWNAQVRHFAQGLWSMSRA